MGLVEWLIWWNAFKNHADLKNLLWSKAGHTIDEDLDLTTHKAVNVVDPVADQDAVTKKYTDDNFAGKTTSATTIYVPSDYATIQAAIDVLPNFITHDYIIGVDSSYSAHEGLDFSGHLFLADLTIKGMDTDDNNLYDDGVADAGGANNELIDATKSWTVDFFNGGKVFIYDGTGEGQIRDVLDTTATTLTVAVNWNINPNATSKYVIVMSELDGNAAVSYLLAPGQSYQRVYFKGLYIHGFTTRILKANLYNRFDIQYCLLIDDNSNTIWLENGSYMTFTYSYAETTGVTLIYATLTGIAYFAHAYLKGATNAGYAKYFAQILKAATVTISGVWLGDTDDTKTGGYAV